MSAVGDCWPDSGDRPEELADLPPGWGPIIVPDDPSELAAEAAALRREIRHRRRRGVPESVPFGTPAQHHLASLRVPVLVMALAVLATLASLLAITWPQKPRRPATGPTVSITAASGRTLPALDLVDASGAVVPLRGLLPAVIILTDGCVCEPELAAAVDAAPSGVTIVEVTSGRSMPSPPPHRPPAVASAVRRLADPVSELHNFLQAAAPAGTGAALLVTRSGQVIRVLPTAARVPDHAADLARLAD